MKTICIYHSRDLDGWMSAAIVKKWFEERQEVHILKARRPGSTVRIPDTLNFLGWDYGDSIPELSDYDKVIMCDISFPANIMLDLRKKLIWIDHHISAIGSIDDYADEYSYTDKDTSIEECIIGLRDTNYAACELTWKYFFPNEAIPEIVRLLGRYDCFGHKGTDEEQEVLEFQYGARVDISSYKEAYEHLIQCTRVKESEYWFLQAQAVVGSLLEKGKVIYEHLCTEAKQIYKKVFPIMFEFKTGPHEDGWSGIPKFGKKKFRFLCVNQERFNPVNFGINYHTDTPGYCGFACFWYKDGKWMWSLYNDNGELDCSVIAKQFGGGGHKGAAGFVCDTNTLLKIIDNV